MTWKLSGDKEEVWYQQMPMAVSGHGISYHLHGGDYDANAFGADTLWSHHFFVAAPLSTLALAISVVGTPGGTINMRLGIYNDSAGVPGSLLVDAGTTSFTTAGMKYIALARTLYPGWYWLASIFDALTPTIRSVAGVGNGAQLEAHGFSSGDDTDADEGYSVAQTYGALPDPFPADDFGGAAPAVVVITNTSPAGFDLMNDPNIKGWARNADWPVRIDLLPPLVAGRFYETTVSMSSQTAGVVTVTLGVLYVSRWFIPSTTTAVSIGIQVTTAIAASNVRLGIYNDSAGVPGSLVVDGGAVATATTGFKTVTISQSLSPGWYWIGGVFSHGIATRRVTGLTATGDIWCIDGFTSNTDVTPHEGFSVAQAYGALPDPFTGGGALMTTSVPRFMLGI